MELETYEIILIVLAIIATIFLFYWALNRDAAEGKPGARAPSEADRAKSADADRAAAAAPREDESASPAAGAARARDAAKSRSGSARRTAKPGALSSRPAGTPAGGQASVSSDEASSKTQGKATPEPEPAAEPQPAPESSPAVEAKPPEPSKPPVAPPGKAVGGSSSPRRDNLTVIRGIGKSIEKKLNAMGVTTFAQIASWTREDLNRVDAALAFPGRAQREDWVGQAKTLAEKK